MGYKVAVNDRSYDEGVAAGEISQRLKGHDEHFERINGSIERQADETSRLADEMARQTMQIQRMADAMEADRGTVLTTASALEKQRRSAAEALRAERETSERKWSPLQRFSLVATVILTILGIVAFIISQLPHK
jgi:hypothetical protein